MIRQKSVRMDTTIDFLRPLFPVFFSFGGKIFLEKKMGQILCVPITGRTKSNEAESTFWAQKAGETEGCALQILFRGIKMRSEFDFFIV